MSKKTTVLSGSDASDDEEIAAPLTVDDSDDYEDSLEFDFEDDKQNPLKEDVKNSEFFLIKKSPKRAVSYFIGEVLHAPNEDDILEVRFLLRQPTKTKGALFVTTEKEDIDEVGFEDIMLKLSKPIIKDGTNRTVKHTAFFFYLD